MLVLPIAPTGRRFDSRPNFQQIPKATSAEIKMAPMRLGGPHDVNARRALSIAHLHATIEALRECRPFSHLPSKTLVA